MIRLEGDQSALQTAKKNPKTGNKEKINFFRKQSNSFLFRDYLYYSHIDRMDHHYKYYIQNTHLIRDILFNDSTSYAKSRFSEICKEIAAKMDARKKNPNVNQIVDIIVSPSDQGEDIFPHAINHYVFKDDYDIIGLSREAA